MPSVLEILFHRSLGVDCPRTLIFGNLVKNKDYLQEESAITPNVLFGRHFCDFGQCAGSGALFE